MNLPNPQGLKRSIARRAFRGATAVALITFLLTVSSVQAGPIRINQVVQTLSPTQGPASLRVDTLQDPAGGTKTPTTNGGPKDGPASSDGPKIDGVLTNISVVQDPQQVGVTVVEEAEVEGTVCDCGDILLPAGGFPKWPLLFLAAVPLVFINHCDDCDKEKPSSTPTPTPPPNPTPTPTPTPEPASLLLFGTGLVAVGAGLRRRYAKSKE